MFTSSSRPGATGSGQSSGEIRGRWTGSDTQYDTHEADAKPNYDTEVLRTLLRLVRASMLLKPTANQYTKVMKSGQNHHLDV